MLLEVRVNTKSVKVTHTKTNQFRDAYLKLPQIGAIQTGPSAKKNKNRLMGVK